MVLQLKSMLYKYVFKIKMKQRTTESTTNGVICRDSSDDFLVYFIIGFCIFNEIYIICHVLFVFLKK